MSRQKKQAGVRPLTSLGIIFVSSSALVRPRPQPTAVTSHRWRANGSVNKQDVTRNGRRDWLRVPIPVQHEERGGGETVALAVAMQVFEEGRQFRDFFIYIYIILFLFPWLTHAQVDMRAHTLSVSIWAKITRGGEAADVRKEVMEANLRRQEDE